MIETGKEMFKNTKDIFYQEVEKRFSNPLLGAFILAWVFCNWDFLYVVLFLDEQYVSILPQIIEGEYQFITKLGYINELGIVTWGNFLFYPLISSFFIVLFIEWITTYLNELIKFVRNWLLGKREEIDRDKHNKLKEDIVSMSKQYREKTTVQNDEILLLQRKNDELELRIDDKVNERLKEEEKKNVKRIKELEGKLDSTFKISDDRLQDIKILSNNIDQLNQENENLVNRSRKFENQLTDMSHDRKNIIDKIEKLQKENAELQQKIKEIDKPIDESLKEDYESFKKAEHFEDFGSLIDEIETNEYRVKNNFYGKYLKYLSLKGIIKEGNDADGNLYYYFTPKGDRFVEYYLDETIGGKGKKIDDGDISVEDLPF